MTDNEYKFWAFLSYSDQDNRAQRADTQVGSCRCWGNWLHDALESFSVPAEFIGQINGRGEIIPERIGPIFRDEPVLPEAADLSAASRRALEQSLCLIVICSPRSASSRQMNEAVRYFKQLGRGQYILPIVIAGEPYASAENQSGQSAADECFVPALSHPVLPEGTIDTTRRAGKSIFVDARQSLDKREILANADRSAEADLEMAKIQLIALLLGVGFNGLWWREQKRHFFDLTAAQHQAEEARQQVEEIQSQLQAAQQQVLEIQNLPRDVHGQIQAAQNQAREAQKELQEVQNKVRDTQIQLEESRHRALAAESKVLEAQQKTRVAQQQLEKNQNQTREAAQLLTAPNPVPEFQEQARAAQIQLQEIQKQSWQARRLTRIFALLAVLALLTTSLATTLAWRQRKLASQVWARAAAVAVGNFELAPGELDQPSIRQVLGEIGGAEQIENRRRSLDKLAAAMPRTEIPEALKAAAVIVSDAQRSHFQKWLLVRLGWENPVSAMACARAIEGKIVDDAGLDDSSTYFQLAVLDNWMETDWPGAFNWVCQLSDADARQRALEKISHDPRLAIQLRQQIAALPAGDNQQAVIKGLLASWAPVDPEAAVNWLGSFPETNAQPEQVQAVIKTWALAEPAAVAQWLAKVPAGTANEAVINAFLEGAVENNPEYAAQWTQAVTDKTQRQKYQIQVALQWLNADPAAALKWIDSLGLPEESNPPLKASEP